MKAIMTKRERNKTEMGKKGRMGVAGGREVGCSWSTHCRRAQRWVKEHYPQIVLHY